MTYTTTLTSRHHPMDLAVSLKPTVGEGLARIFETFKEVIWWIDIFNSLILGTLYTKDTSATDARDLDIITFLLDRLSWLNGFHHSNL